MSKSTISLNFRQQMYMQESDEVAIALLELKHPDTSEVLLISGDNTTLLDSEPELVWGTVSRGRTYIYRPLSLRLPSDVADRPPRMHLVVENVTGAMVAFCASMIQRGTCDIDIVTASAPSTVQIPFPIMDLRGFSRNSDIISFEIGMDAAEDEPIPAGLFTPSGFPGAFA
jgi:hypothetical protein